MQGHGRNRNEDTRRHTHLAFPFCFGGIARSDQYDESTDILLNQNRAKRLPTVKQRVCPVLHRFSTGSAAVSCSRSTAHHWRESYVRGRCAERLAYASVRSNLDRDGGHRLDSAVGRTDRGNSKRRRYLDSGGSEALAWRYPQFSDDAHRNTGRAQRQSRGMDGAGNRRAIPQVIHSSPERQEVKMKPMALMIVALSLISTTWAQGQHTQTGRKSEPMQTMNDITMVAPALEKYAQGPLADLWKRPGLTPRDRSIVTVAALIARNQTIEMPYYFNLALDNGVKPREISEIITHLAFYSGWENAMSAVAVAKDVFAGRKIGADQLPAASPAPLPLDKDAEAKRAAVVEQQFGNVAPGIVQYTTDVLFRDLWLRPDLAPRDRSLVTVTALIAAGQVAQIGYHLNRAMDNGLTQTQAAEVVTHLAFYAGWPNAFSALPIMKDVFEQRPH